MLSVPGDFLWLRTPTFRKKAVILRPSNYEFVRMKILHTADWHLGNTFHGHSRFSEHRHFLDWLLCVLRQRQPDVMIISGDVFDSANPPAAAERLLYDFLMAATEAVKGMQVVLIAGNHDSAGRLEAPAELLRCHNIYVRSLIRRNGDTGEPDFDYYLLPLSSRTETVAEAVCFALPYLRASDYPGGLSVAEGIAWYLDNFCKRLRKSGFKGLPVIVTAHFYAAGAEVCGSEHSERLVIGGQDCVEAGRVDCGASYTALGHIHKAQRVNGAACDMYYAGSVLPMSFSEKHYRHGVQWVEMDEKGETAVSRIGYAPMRRLLSIPETGAAEPQTVLEAIAGLAVRGKDDDGSEWPYLEIRVLESQPQPSLMHEVSIALEDKAVHFCRMVRELPRSDRQPERVNSLESLRALSPLEMVRKVFASRYNSPMPSALEQRFSQAAAAAMAEETAHEPQD